MRVQHTQNYSSWTKMAFSYPDIINKMSGLLPHHHLQKIKMETKDFNWEVETQTKTL